VSFQAAPTSEKKIIVAGRLLVGLIFEKDCVAEYALGASLLLLLLLLRPIGPQGILETLCFTSVS
jgi:hypothetical protein